MDVDDCVSWLVTALKFSEGPDGVKKDQLIQNVNSCFLRVKKETKCLDIPASQAAQEIQDFQTKASVILLLCLPKIRELSSVKNCEDFQSIISSLPELSIDIFFTVIRTQKTYFLLSPLLSWLPPSIVQALTKEYYFHHAQEVTPLTLTVAVELLRALLFSNKYWYAHSGDSFQSNIECLELLVKFFSLKSVSTKTQATRKLSGYLFMYVFESVFLLLASYVGYPVRDPDSLSCVETWTSLWKTGNASTESTRLSFIKETILSVLQLCQDNSQELTVDMWMEWSEHMLPPTLVVHPSLTQPHRKEQVKSIQLVTRNIAFDILKVFEAHPQLDEDLATIDYHELLQYLRQVAIDPEYDPDKDLTNEQLVHEIHKKDDRQNKLLELLFLRNEALASDDACRCLREYGVVLENKLKMQLLQHWIECIKMDESHIVESVNVILDLAEDLSPSQLKSIIETNLSAGLDNILKTPTFEDQLTRIFNQLADEKYTECSGRHVWLCLQSGRGVVEQAVKLAVTMTGLVPVMVHALADLPPVCHAELPSGHSLLAHTLLEWQTTELAHKEQQAFILLIKSLLSGKEVLDTKEVLELMVKPFLIIECSRNLEKLIIPLELLKELVTQDWKVVVRPGPGIVSVIMALSHVVDATVYLEGQHTNNLLYIRSLASTILMEITNIIIGSQKLFEREITILKQMVCECNLHSRSVVHVSKVVEGDVSANSGGGDLLLPVLMKASLDPPHGASRNPVLCADADCDAFNNMFNSEIIIYLLQVLPHCSQSEWVAAFFLLDRLKKTHNTVFQVLEVLQGVLYLLCETVNPSVSLNQQESHPSSSPVSLHHCFSCFASASMIYIGEKFQAHNSRERLLNLADVFQWWCCIVPCFNCNPELPTLFLAQLCGALEEIVASGKLKALPEEHTKTDTVFQFQISDMREKEAKCFPEEQEPKKINSMSKSNKKQYEEFDQSCDTRDNFCIFVKNLKREVDQMTYFMIKYVPFCNLLASVASKLKKIYEL